MTSHPRTLLRRLAAVILLAAAIAAPLWRLHVIAPWVPSSQSDLLPRWIGTQVALAGHDPYSARTQHMIERAYYGEALHHGKPNRRQAFLYPAHVVLLLLPLAHLSWQAARITYTAIVLPLLVASFWLCLRSLKLRLSPGQTAAVLILACFSWPVVWGLRLEQLTLPVAALIFFAGFLLAQGRQAIPGLLLAFTTIKPQLVLPLLVWLVLWAILRRNWAFIVSFAGSLVALLTVTECIVPGWWPHWLASLHGYSAITNTAPPLEFLLGSWLGLPLTILIAAVATLALWRLRRSSPNSAEFGLGVSLTLALAVTLAPTDAAMLYNQVLLLPACLLLLFHRPTAPVSSLARRFALAVLFAEFVIVAVSALGDAITGVNDFWQRLLLFDHFLAPTLAFALASGVLSRTTVRVSQPQPLPVPSCP